MIPRYSRKVMARIWTEENKFASWLKVELAAMAAMAECGLIPPEVPKRAARKAKIDVARILEIEAKTHHDVAAFVDQVAAGLGEDGRYFHFGLTSSDVLDTALGLRLTEAADLLLADLDELLAVLKEQAYAFKDQAMVGRTHGVHAEPITLGLKFALWYAEFQRQRARLVAARKTIAVGKISGAVGTFAHLAPEVEAGVCKRLKLKPAPISTQVIQRDRHAEYFLTLALIGASVEKVALEIRHLQRTEVREAEEMLRRRPEGLFGHAPQAQPDPLGKPLRPGPGAPGQRPGGPGKRGPVARAGHQPLLGGAPHRPGFHRAPGFHAGPAHPAPQKSPGLPGEHGRQSQLDPGPGLLPVAAAGPDRQGPEPGTRPTGWCSARPCRSGRKGANSPSGSRPTPRSANT